MPHTIEPARSGRAKCHGCGQTIAKGEMRFGERLPNPFADGEMTHWFHPRCAAYKRPEAILETLPSVELDEHALLQSIAEDGLKHRRLPRVNGIERAPSGRARCRNCKERIGKDAWRIPLVFHEEGRFNPSGFIHLGCAGAYLGTTAIVDRIRHFAGDLDVEAVAEIRNLIGAP
jgi:hypothetical protein